MHSYLYMYYILTLVRCLLGTGENRDSRELARELEIMIARRVTSYRVEMVEVMIMNQDSYIIDINFSTIITIIKNIADYITVHLITYNFTSQISVILINLLILKTYT